MAAILVHLKLDCRGNWSVFPSGLFDELCVIYRLNSRGAAIDENTLQVEGNKATLEEGVDTNKGNVGFCAKFGPNC